MKKRTFTREQTARISEIQTEMEYLLQEEVVTTDLISAHSINVKYDSVERLKDLHKTLWTIVFEVYPDMKDKGCVLLDEWSLESKQIVLQEVGGIE